MKTLFSKEQKRLARKHGTPAEFARAAYEAVPGMISMFEARVAIEKYNAEWDAAGYLQPTKQPKKTP